MFINVKFQCSTPAFGESLALDSNEFCEEVTRILMSAACELEQGVPAVLLKDYLGNLVGSASFSIN